MDQTAERIQQKIQTLEQEHRALLDDAMEHDHAAQASRAKAKNIDNMLTILRDILAGNAGSVDAQTGPAVPSPEPKGTWHEAADVILKNGGPIELAKLLGVLTEQGFTVQYGSLAQHARRSAVAGTWEKTGRGQYGIKEVKAQVDEDMWNG